MSLKKPIAEICTGLFCFKSTKINFMKEQLNDFDEINFDETSFNKILPLKYFEFVECTFNSIDFTQLNLSLNKFIECKFENCNLSNVSVKNTLLRDCHFINCKVIGVNFSETQAFTTPSFFESALDYSVFQLLNLTSAIFKNCSMREVDFYEANLSKAEFSGSLLEGAVFNGANLTAADFRGAQDYSIDLRVTNVKKAKFSIPEALNLLKALDVSLE